MNLSLFSNFVCYGIPRVTKLPRCLVGHHGDEKEGGDNLVVMLELQSSVAGLVRT